MPVARELILQIAITMAKDCKTKPCVIALVGDHDKEPISKQVETDRSEVGN